MGNPSRVYPLVAWLSFFGCFVQLVTVSGATISFLLLCSLSFLFFVFSFFSCVVLCSPSLSPLVSACANLISLLQKIVVQLFCLCFTRVLSYGVGSLRCDGCGGGGETSLIQPLNKSNRKIFICSTKRHSTCRGPLPSAALILHWPLSLSLSCANIVALSIIYDLYFAASAPHGPVAKF